jgi:hypothetical protein
LFDESPDEAEPVPLAFGFSFEAVAVIAGDVTADTI